MAKKRNFVSELVRELADTLDRLDCVMQGLKKGEKGEYRVLNSGDPNVMNQKIRDAAFEAQRCGFLEDIDPIFETLDRQVTDLMTVGHHNTGDSSEWKAARESFAGTIKAVEGFARRVDGRQHSKETPKKNAQRLPKDYEPDVLDDRIYYLTSLGKSLREISEEITEDQRRSNKSGLTHEAVRKRLHKYEIYKARHRSVQARSRGSKDQTG